MGNFFSRLQLDKKWADIIIPCDKTVQTLMVGLDGAGKTTILNKLKFGQRNNISTTPDPTIGFNVQLITYKNKQFTIWDLGGQDKIRPLWRSYYHCKYVIIFVIDSHDKDRFDLAVQQLYKILKEDELRDAKLLVLANKQDLSNAVTAKEITKQLQLDHLKNRRWYVQDCCGLNSDGLNEGMDWLCNQLFRSFDVWLG